MGDESVKVEKVGENGLREVGVEESSVEKSNNGTSKSSRGNTKSTEIRIKELCLNLEVPGRRSNLGQWQHKLDVRSPFHHPSLKHLPHLLRHPTFSPPALLGLSTLAPPPVGEEKANEDEADEDADEEHKAKSFPSAPENAAQSAASNLLNDVDAGETMTVGADKALSLAPARSLLRRHC
ncbi:hypothetical protein B0H19DRAFT_1083713 [Mycena capillaripes]|nr:hypothetical protein B0H19DRAFT_1083713 [Mycena capillaripes]